MTLSQGQVVHNRYRIARLLGQGGMGAVYRAWDLNLNIPVALKEMLPEPGLDHHRLTQLRAQFQREAQVLASITHPSLPRVTDYFEWEGRSYLVMDFVEGESLDQLIARQGRLPEAQVMNWAVQLLHALATCHAYRIVHRDVKPQNIIIRPDGRAVLVDFGLVKLWDPSHPQTQRIVQGMGTAEYASPEHFYLNRLHTEPRSDLYSLGATLYHALAGCEPPSALDRWAGTTSPPSLRGTGANVHPQVERIIFRAMELDQAQRFPGAQEMLAELQAATGIQILSLEPTKPTIRQGEERPVPVARDTRWMLEMVTGMAMALVGVLTIQVVLFAGRLTWNYYLGRGIGALLLGGLGWFLGDLVFQALAQPERVARTPGGGRPTQRLVAFTRRMARRLTTAQQVILLVLLLACAVALVWLLGPPVARIPLVADYVQFYALIGPLAYAAAGRRPGRTLVAHTLVTTLAGAVLGGRIGITQDVGALFLASAGGGVLMEGLAFLAERFLLR